VPCRRARNSCVAQDQIAEVGHLREVRPAGVSSAINLQEEQLLEVRQAGQVAQAGIVDSRVPDPNDPEVFQAPQERQAGLGDCLVAVGSTEIEFEEPVEILDRRELVVGCLFVESNRDYLLKVLRRDERAVSERPATI